LSNKFKLLGILLIFSVLAVPLVGCVEGLTLTISEPKDGAILTESHVTVSGTVSDPKATVTINGAEVEVESSGLEVPPSLPLVKPFTFSAEVELTPGENTITVVATLGEETITKTVTVTYTPSGLTGEV
jgi:hypothetical protein